MSILKGMADILIADSAVNAAIAGRVFITSAFDSTALPYVIIEAVMQNNTYTKDKDSTVDTYSAEVFIYHNSISEAIALGLLCRDALQGYSGTINGVSVQGCYLTSESDDEGEIDGRFIPVWTQDYQIRLKR